MLPLREGHGLPPRIFAEEFDVLRQDAAMDAIVGANPKLFKLAEGFTFTEGPIWVHQGGYLLFSDPNENTIYQYTEAGALSVFRRPSGYEGADIAAYRQPGSNGLTLDPEGRLTINEHGNRRVTRLEADGTLTVLAGPQVAEAAGILKEMNDANGGSGFSFADLAADLAGISFARRLQAEPALLSSLSSSFSVNDYMPPVVGLREGLTRENLQADYGSPSDQRFLAERTAILKVIRALPGSKTASKNED